MKTTLTLIMIVLCAGMVAVWNINGAQNMNVPPMDGRGYPQTFYQSFKGNPVKPPKMHFVGPGAQEFVKFEPEGLRITLPAGRPPQPSAIGLATDFAVGGDFEVTMSFEILAEPKPEHAGAQTKVNLRAVLNRPGTNMVAHHRRVTQRGNDFFVWRSLKSDMSGRNEQISASRPTSAMNGRLQLVRKGSTIAANVAEGPGGEFTLLKEYPFGDEDVNDVAIVAATGGPEAALDVRITDFMIRATSFPSTAADKVVAVPTGTTVPNNLGDDTAKGKLAAVLLIGLLITVSIAFALWFVVRRRPGVVVSDDNVNKSET